MPFTHGHIADSPLRFVRRLSLNACVRSLHSHRLTQLRTVTASSQKEEEHKPISPADALTKTLSGMGMLSTTVVTCKGVQ